MICFDDEKIIKSQLKMIESMNYVLMMYTHLYEYK